MPYSISSIYHILASRCAILWQFNLPYPDKSMCHTLSVQFTILWQVDVPYSISSIYHTLTSRCAILYQFNLPYPDKSMCHTLANIRIFPHNSIIPHYQRAPLFHSSPQISHSFLPHSLSARVRRDLTPSCRTRSIYVSAC